ncbi:MAG TPA: radical SAM protein [Geopsychrobacteraceae bacterium]
MKILLATLHVRPSAQATPLAAACLKAALPEPLRDQTRLLDLYLSQSPEQMLAAIRRLQPDVVAFPLYLWNRQPVLALARELRRLRPELFLLAGGPEASADSRTILADGGLDALIRGEGEEVFAALMTALAQGAPIRDLAGVATPDKPRPAPVYCEDLDRLPSPYLHDILTPQAGGGLLWEVARGCPFDCAFCYDAKGRQGVRPFSMARLEAELELFVARGTQQIWILDSTFNFPAQRGRQLLQLLLEKAPNIHYHLEAKADFLDAETVRLLAQLQCSVQIGLQSADPRVLKPLNRSFDPERLFGRLRMLSEAGVVFGLDLIYGLPGDSHRGFRQSLDAALATGPNQLDLFPLAVLPGTRLYRDRDKLGLRIEPSPPYEILGSPGYPPEQLAHSRLLAAATDIFYNRGRAVGFMLPVCQALGSAPVDLLERFARWLLQEQNLPPEQLLAVDRWQPARILPLQLAFLNAELHGRGKSHLQPLVSDLLLYHYHYAETLLGPELVPQPALRPAAKGWRHCWRRAEQLRLVAFNYELDELLTMGGMELESLQKTLTPSGSTGIFLRRGQEVLCESLQDSFAELLKGSDGTAAPAEILPGCDPEEGLELLAFALAEGLLQR